MWAQPRTEAQHIFAVMRCIFAAPRLFAGGHGRPEAVFILFTYMIILFTMNAGWLKDHNHPL